METDVAYRPSGLFLEQARPPSSSRWALGKDRLTVGRDPSSDVFITDTLVSRHHADLIRHGLNWLIIDAGSANGTFVNDARVREAPLQPDDRIRLGGTELVLRRPGHGHMGREEPGAYFNMEKQQGNINNIAGGQYNYSKHESNLQYIASRRGRARYLIVCGILLFFAGSGISAYEILRFDSTIFNATSPADIQQPSFLLLGVAVFFNLFGILLFIFGLITRSGAKREAKRLEVDWS